MGTEGGGEGVPNGYMAVGYLLFLQEQYKNLLTGLQAVGQVKGWKIQQIVFVGGTDPFMLNHSTES
jgi:hypothetical protein